MKRDMDLIRLLLLKIEASEDSDGIDSPEIKGYSEGQIAYHLRLLIDGGLIDVKDDSLPFQGGEFYMGINLTWDGQEFVNAAKNEPLWAKAKETFLTSGVGFTVQSLLVWLKGQASAVAQSLL